MSNRLYEFEVVPLCEFTASVQKAYVLWLMEEFGEDKVAAAEATGVSVATIYRILQRRPADRIPRSYIRRNALPQRLKGRRSVQACVPVMTSSLLRFFHVDVKGGMSGFWSRPKQELEWIFHDLRQSYLQMAKIAHPDIGGNGEMTVINEAWNRCKKLFKDHGIT